MEGLAGKQADAVSPAGAGWNLARRPVKNSDVVFFLAPTRSCKFNTGAMQLSNYSDLYSIFAK